jgi:hypothetical protein
MKITQDNAFMESHLHASDFDEINKRALDTSKYDMFLKYVSMSMTNNRKRKAERFTKERLTKTDVVEVEIDNFDPDTYVLEEPPVLRRTTATSEAPPEQIQVPVEIGLDMEEEEEPADEETDSKKRARSKSTTQKEAKRKSKESRVQLDLKLARDREKEYLSEKKDILERIPEEYSKHIGKIVFGKWRKEPYRPVLLAGPYQVPPGTLRDAWMKMFENVSTASPNACMRC